MPPSPLRRGGNQRILVIDDHEAIHHDFRKILGPGLGEEFEVEEAAIFGGAVRETPPLHFELSFCSQGQDAIALVQAALQEGRPYAVVFTDVRMPPGWDGLETAARLWEIDPDLQIVLCTAYSDKSWGEMMETVSHPERVLILKKPFDAIEVLQLAHSLTEKWSLLQAARRNMQDLERAVDFRTRELQSTNTRLEAEIAVRRATEVALRKSERSLAEKAALLDKAQDAIFVHDLSGRVLYWNGSAERLYGWAPEEAIGHEIGLLIEQDAQRWEEANHATLNSGDWIGELVQCPRHGRELMVESRWTLVRNERGQPQSILVINTDLTEKKQLQEKFLRAQRMESIGTLAGGIAHDLNNILHPISLSVEILRQELGDSEGNELLDLIMTSSHRASLLVKQVLSFARGVKGQCVPIPPNTLAHEIGNIIRATFPKKVHFQSRLDANAWTLLGDATQLHQVLLNLCVNARDAMPCGGTLTISTANIEVDELQAAMQPGVAPGRYVVFSVSDTGTGIPENLREKIFEPFFTTKDHGKGTGLGLATTLDIVRSHNGFMTLDSAIGSGTTFRVLLPVFDSPDLDEALAGGNRTAGLRGNNEWVLVVDDELPILTTMRTTLECSGYRVLCAADGFEAMKLYAENLSRVRAVVMDLSMPCMDGATLVGALKRIHPSVNIIAATGTVSAADLATMKRLGVERVLSKPFPAYTLLQTLKESFAESGGRVTPGMEANMPATILA